MLRVKGGTAAGLSIEYSEMLYLTCSLSTLCCHKLSLQADLMSLLESRDPEAYRATMCCQRIRISRSTGVSSGPTRHKMLIHIKCEQKREYPAGSGGKEAREECQGGVKGRD